MDTARIPHPSRNPKTHISHKRDVFWQITLPLVIGILLVLAAMAAIIFSATQPVTDVSRWADVSLIWLILPSLFIALILLAITIGLVIAISQLLKVVPRIACILQLYFVQGKDKISHLTNLIVEPILRLNSFLAAARRASKLKRRESQE
jgi:uncharacterized membrane protein YhdT